MKNILFSHFALCVCAFVALTDAFQASTQSNPAALRRTAPTRSTLTVAHAVVGKRREVFGWVKRAAVLGLGFKSASALSKPANAADALEEAVNGRIVTFQVNNLGGEEGKSGTVKIQMAPTWAPRGVARFEVCTIVPMKANRAINPASVVV